MKVENFMLIYEDFWENFYKMLVLNIENISREKINCRKLWEFKKKLFKGIVYVKEDLKARYVFIFG